MASKGVDILLYANTGTDASPVYTVVGGQKGATLTEELDTVEMTSKLSPGAYKEYEPGQAGWSIKCDGLYIKDDVAYLKLQQAIRSKLKLKVQVWESSTAFFTGTVIVTSKELDAPFDDAATYSLELQGTGQPTYP